ncbi:MAG: hypothetical protein ACREVG_13655 [Burkholderiales bacterium]
MTVKHPFRRNPIALSLVVALCASFPVAAQGPKDSSADLKRAREALDKYKDPVVAVHDGYFSTLGCVTYPKPGKPGQVPYQAGGMGVHFFNVSLLGAPLDPTKPQVLVYEPVGGKLQLVAAEWFIPLSPELKGRPELFGRPFDGPMEGHHPLMPHGLHHYDLHVWLWKDNPSGMFAPTNPKIKCPKGPYTFEETAPKIVPHK